MGARLDRGGRRSERVAGCCRLPNLGDRGGRHRCRNLTSANSPSRLLSVRRCRCAGRRGNRREAAGRGRVVRMRAAVVSLVLCSVPDQRRLAEAHLSASLRWDSPLLRTRPGPEEPRSERQDPRRLDLASSLGGCHANRDSPRRHLRGRIPHRNSAAGSSSRPCAILAPVSPHIIGEAVRI